ncbi:efflux RND transporter periplasmic adaptor subunit [Hydrogenophaga borbori]|uniref:efflux RND transporter periplasmic adaptor subunit n=1 Tax=Hydrogenophaga borbori TaxID=2294117 RepID=UPI00301E187C
MNDDTTPRRRRVRLITAATAVALAIAALLAWALRPAALPVEIATVQRGDFEQAIEEDGVLRLLQRYTVAAPTAGELLRPGLKVGDTVAEGEPLAVLRPAAPSMIDSRTREVLRQRVGSAEAALAATRAQAARSQAALAQAELDARRSEELARAQFVAPSAREQAQLNLTAARQALAGAQAEQRVAAHGLSEARAALARADGGSDASEGLWTLRSPIAGRVIAVHRDSAGPVGAGQALMELGDTTRLEAIVDLLSGDAARVPPGAAVTLQAGSGLPALPGRVTRVEPVAFTKVSALGIEEQRVNVHVEPAAPWPGQLPLGEGYRVEARIVTLAQADALLVPNAALVRTPTGWQVFVVDGDGRARARALTLGPRGTEQAVATDGLRAGERVVLYPGNGVREGQRVRER